MKHTFASLILTASALATFGASSIQAADRALANVPFAFYLNSKLMPAGTYEVKEFSKGDGAMLTIMDARGRAQFVRAPLTSQADPSKPKLTFAHYGDQYTLIKVDLPGSSVAHGLRTKLNYKLGMASMISVGVTR
jgi:hypothetical protein